MTRALYHQGKRRPATAKLAKAARFVDAPRPMSDRPEAEAEATEAEDSPKAPSVNKTLASPRYVPASATAGTAHGGGIGSESGARLTLVFTSFIFLVILFAWGGAKVACNLHPPEYEAFKPAPLSRLASTPKDGALEFHHRLALLDFEGAKELQVVSEAGASLVEKAQQACGSSCLKEKSARAASALTRAIVLRRDGRAAVVRAETHFQGKVDAQTYRVEWDQKVWKVSGLAE